jgi:hypothetical protein
MADKDLELKVKIQMEEVEKARKEVRKLVEEISTVNLEMAQLRAQPKSKDKTIAASDKAYMDSRKQEQFRLREKLIGTRGRAAEEGDELKELKTDLKEANKEVDMHTSLMKKYRQTLTSVLIDLHVLRILASQSKVMAFQFQTMGQALGYLTDMVLMPLIPAMVQFLYLIYGFANFYRQLHPVFKSFVAATLSLIVGLFMLWRVTNWVSITLLEFRAALAESAMVQLLFTNIVGGLAIVLVWLEGLFSALAFEVTWLLAEFGVLVTEIGIYIGELVALIIETAALIAEFFVLAAPVIILAGLFSLLAVSIYGLIQMLSIITGTGSKQDKLKKMKSDAILGPVTNFYDFIAGAVGLPTSKTAKKSGEDSDNTLLKKSYKLLKDIISPNTSIIARILMAIYNFIQGLFSGGSNALGATGDALKSAGAALWDWINDLWNNLVELGQRLWAAVSTFIDTFFQDPLGATARFVTTVIDSFIQFFRDSLKDTRDLASELWDIITRWVRRVLPFGNQIGDQMDNAKKVLGVGMDITGQGVDYALGMQGLGKTNFSPGGGTQNITINVTPAGQGTPQQYGAAVRSAAREMYEQSKRNKGVSP